MLTIGEFAGVTGLSVKALRHYDDKGALSPADVSHPGGHRRYDEAQVRAGVLVKTLRDAGVSLPTVAAAVANGTAMEELQAHRRDVLRAREAEDAAFDRACAVLRALSVPVEVVEREMPAQAYVGRVLTLDPDGADPVDDDEANAAFGELFERVQGAGLGPAGMFWTAMREGERGAVDLVCCWPTLVRAGADWHEGDTIVGELPARRELTAIWRASSADLPDGAVHPASVALFDRIGDRRMDTGGFEVRQNVVSAAGRDAAVEVSVTLAPHE
ncbi:MerR family transcriptional regulator [Microbacterium sp. zg.Y625]|uniref:MerR family transcriptional regulator n=1 Tax=Microbacterium jiangjiandongii TaxID=3049071 RepID=UPI00214B9947|nr:MULTISPECIES: MerR family transcriptional regulator [unclassified Microbacterium]MCR2791877.1 MerR family transcriptional regulator [Microbacterium sp. zg.Y625]WIM24691.1 MerR family transcriptional regulator [Microbacterium sp. zg-Y625]